MDRREFLETASDWARGTIATYALAALPTIENRTTFSELLGEESRFIFYGTSDGVEGPYQIDYHRPNLSIVEQSPVQPPEPPKTESSNRTLIPYAARDSEPTLDGIRADLERLYDKEVNFKVIVYDKSVEDYVEKELADLDDRNRELVQKFQKSIEFYVKANQELKERYAKAGIAEYKNPLSGTKNFILALNADRVSTAHNPSENTVVLYAQDDVGILAEMPHASGIVMPTEKVTNGSGDVIIGGGLLPASARRLFIEFLSNLSDPYFFDIINYNNGTKILSDQGIGGQHLHFAVRDIYIDGSKKKLYHYQTTVEDDGLTFLNKLISIIGDKAIGEINRVAASFSEYAGLTKYSNEQILSLYVDLVAIFKLLNALESRSIHSTNDNLLKYLTSIEDSIFIDRLDSLVRQHLLSNSDWKSALSDSDLNRLKAEAVATTQARFNYLQDTRYGRAVQISSFSAKSSGVGQDTGIKVQVAPILKDQSKIFANIRSATGEEATIEITDVCDWIVPDEQDVGNHLLQGVLRIPAKIKIGNYFFDITNASVALAVSDRIDGTQQTQLHQLQF